MGSFARYVLSLGAVVLVLILGLAGLAQLKFSAFLSDSIGERMEIVGTAAAQDFRAAIDLGLRLDEVANGPLILARVQEHDPSISGISVIDLDGTIVHGSGDLGRSEVHPDTLAALRRARSDPNETEWNVEADDQIRTGVLIEGSFGRPLGAVVVRYPATEMRAQERAIAGELLFDAAWVTVALGIAVLLLLWAIRRRGITRASLVTKQWTGSQPRRSHPQNASGETASAEPPAGARGDRVVAGISILLVVGVVVFGGLIVGHFNDALEPELERRASLIGASIRDDVERALELDIPLTELRGMDAYFDVLLADFQELDYLAIRDLDERIAHAGGNVPAAAHDPELAPAGTGAVDLDGSLVSRYGLVVDEQVMGAVDVGVDSGFVRTRLEDLALDTAVILIVALLVAYELTLLVGRRISSGASGPDPGRRAGMAADIRLVLFLFVVSEELSKSFLPQLILAADNPVAGLDPALAVSLPIMAYLLTLAIASPFADRLSHTLGHRGLFLLGVTAAAASNLGMVVASDLLQIVGLRALTGVGYAFATIACLEYLLDRQPDESRVRTIGVFVAVVIGGTFAGTALGGILADRLGYDAVFAIGFVLVLATGILAIRLMHPGRRAGQRDTALFAVEDIRRVLRQPRLLGLLAGVTVPMNVLVAAFLWYLVPLILAAEGSGAAVIGRTLMLYYLVILLAGPAVARLGDRYVHPWALVGVGSALAGAVLLLPAADATVVTVSSAVIAVGFGHAAVRGPQIALALDIAEAEMDLSGRAATLAAMRSLERLGSLAGLLFVALLTAAFDLQTATGAIGLLVALAGTAYVLSHPGLAGRIARA